MLGHLLHFSHFETHCFSHLNWKLSGTKYISTYIHKPRSTSTNKQTQSSVQSNKLSNHLVALLYTKVRETLRKPTPATPLHKLRVTLSDSTKLDQFHPLCPPQRPTNYIVPKTNCTHSRMQIKLDEGHYTHSIELQAGHRFTNMSALLVYFPI